VTSRATLPFDDPVYPTPWWIRALVGSMLAALAVAVGCQYDADRERDRQIAGLHALYPTVDARLVRIESKLDSLMELRR
jgi:hypothetical protein